MSKVIIKIGPNTKMVEKDDIVVVDYGNSPKTTIKYSKDHSVVFFERNPYYVTITEPNEVKDICHLLDVAESAREEAEHAATIGDPLREEKSLTEHRRYTAMASMNIESVIAAYISRNLFDDFSTSIIKALKNAKKVAYRAATRSTV